MTTFCIIALSIIHYVQNTWHKCVCTKTPCKNVGLKKACKIEPKFKIFPFSINHFIIVSQKVGAILQAIQFMRDKLCFDWIEGCCILRAQHFKNPSADFKIQNEIFDMSEENEHGFDN